MFKIGRLHFSCNKSLDYVDNLKAYDADLRWDSSLRADSSEIRIVCKNLNIAFGAERVNAVFNGILVKSLGRLFSVYPAPVRNTIFFPGI